jgi:hypothetical protein
MRSIKLIIAAFILCLWQLVTAHSELSASTTVPVDSTITALPSLATTAAPELELRAGANTCGYIQGKIQTFWDLEDAIERTPLTLLWHQATSRSP